MRRVGSQKVIGERKNTITNNKKQANHGNYNLQLPLELIQERVKPAEIQSQRNSSRFRNKNAQNQHQIYFKNDDQ